MSFNTNNSNIPALVIDSMQSDTWFDKIKENGDELREECSNIGVYQQTDNSNNCEVKEISSSNNPMNIQLLIDDISVIKLENEKLYTEIRTLKRRVLDSEYLIEENTDYIYFLEKEVSRIDQYGRRENVEISGIPENISDEELEKTVIAILQKMGLKRIQSYGIVGCHQLGKRDRFGNRNTIIRFVNRKDAIWCFQNRKNLQLCRELGFRNLFLMENLCPAYRSIFDELNKRRSNGDIKKVWAYNVTVQFKYTDNPMEKSNKVFHECDLNFYFNKGNISSGKE